PECLREVISKSWAEKREDRPTFEQIEEQDNIGSSGSGNSLGGVVSGGQSNPDSFL
ncbi:unnamed protein product, partial [Choristocarpus tenellus]